MENRKLMNDILATLIKLSKASVAYGDCVLNNQQKREYVQTLCRFGVLDYDPKKIFLTKSELADLEAEIINQHGGEIETQELLKMFLDVGVYYSNSYSCPDFATLEKGRISLFNAPKSGLYSDDFDEIAFAVIKGITLPDWIDDIPVIAKNDINRFTSLIECTKIIERDGKNIILHKGAHYHDENPSEFRFDFLDAESKVVHCYVKNVQRGLSVSVESHELIIGRAKDFNKRVTDAIDATVEYLKKQEQAA